jgi:hypothetical protein
MKEKETAIQMDKITLSIDRTHHIYNRQPLYNKRFTRVMSFHPPGLAPVLDETRAYHILLDGEPAYNPRFQKTFGFYEERAAVKDVSGWFHIDHQGKPTYAERYDWVGNYQEERVAVNKCSQYFHIKKNGIPAYRQRYRYAGNYKEGIAVVYRENGLATHIDKLGNMIHGKEFIELDIFHKGYAVARDKKGFFHISMEGKPFYAQRYEWIEPFYNGRALARKYDGSIITLDEETLKEIVIRD